MLLPPALQNTQRGVEADVVCQGEGPHGVARAELHGDVDVGYRGVAAVVHGHGLSIGDIIDAVVVVVGVNVVVVMVVLVSVVVVVLVVGSCWRECGGGGFGGDGNRGFVCGGSW